MIASRPLRIVFDLDDTLYDERDYALSALGFAGRRIDEQHGSADAGQRRVSMFDAGDRDAIGTLCQELGMATGEKSRLIDAMRAHRPDIFLRPDSARLLRRLRSARADFSILTDGRSVTQRAKIAALGLVDARHIIVSEEIGAAKPSTTGYEKIAAAGPDADFVYVGDNPEKDFVAPNRLGWSTVMVMDRGANIHPQTGAFDPVQLPQHRIRSLDDLGSALGREL
jgi:putative hydrolase of the HAD superfamily